MSRRTASPNFALPPPRRRRARELSFYRWLACSALLGILPVLALAMRIDGQTDGIGMANRLLAAELHTLQPQLDQRAASQSRIAHMQSRLATLNDQAALRARAASLLRAASAAALPEIRLYRIALQPRAGELRGHAADVRDIQAYANALLHAGMERVAIQDLRATDRHADDGRYDFTLSLPFSPPPLHGDRHDDRPADASVLP
ncbi:Tfp pilus assembly protein PilN [Herbaspirillum sp. SJZ130]|nr:Tfp pilus assembly protein PilN [Herbaspirillum sp. SJZ130]TQK14139.1 Tfp pilus assembly protein PilN [Herbaspirillum sp. SJZ106]